MYKDSLSRCVFQKQPDIMFTWAHARKGERGGGGGEGGGRERDR